MEKIELSEYTIGEMVSEDYRKAEVFKSFGLDFCCGGKKTIDVACSEKDIDVNALTQALLALDTDKAGADRDFNEMKLDELVNYIIATHHKYVAAAIPLISEFSAKVAKVHGHANPEVVEIDKHFRSIAGELTMHMHKEEMVLFPYINKIVATQRLDEKLTASAFGTVRNPIRMMEAEHEFAGNEMTAIDELSNHYTPPDHACNTYRVLYAKLNEFEADLHQHIHLENNILFPKAIALEEQLLK